MPLPPVIPRSEATRDPFRRHRLDRQTRSAEGSFAAREIRPDDEGFVILRPTIPMDRRKFLKHAATLPALPALAPLIAKISPRQKTAATAAKPFRRVRPSDPDWPTPAMWDSLKKQVGGRLIPVADPLAPCKPSPADATCTTRLADLKNPF